MAGEVNGYTANPRYVSDRVGSTRDYLTAMMDPVFVRLLQQLYMHTPPSGSVQPFIVQALRDELPAVPPSAAVDRAAMKRYFASAVDPLLQELARAVAKAAPDDVAAFLLELCTKHEDLERDLIPASSPRVVAPPPVAPPGARAGAGIASGRAEASSAAPSAALPVASPSAVASPSKSPPRPSADAAAAAGDAAVTHGVLRNGMRLGNMHVVVTLTHDAAGTATFIAHCPRTGREASVHVSPDDETLADLLASHGVDALYHVDQYLVLTETPSGDLHLEWQP
jgi:hypothetical protein